MRTKKGRCPGCGQMLTEGYATPPHVAQAGPVWLCVNPNCAVNDLEDDPLDALEEDDDKE
jgi:hypothetical protein